MEEVPVSTISELKLKLSVTFGRGMVLTRPGQYTPWGVCDRDSTVHSLGVCDRDSTFLGGL